jgi:hypothetical protein
MTNGEDFVVNVDLDLAASDILTRGDEFARFEGRRKEVRAMATGRRFGSSVSTSAMWRSTSPASPAFASG